MSQTRRFRHSLRFKLLLVGLTLLAIPWAGYRFIQETETLLRSNQEQGLLDQARNLATLMQRESARMPQVDESAEPTPHEIYLHELSRAPQVDGYTDDWRELLADAQVFAAGQRIEGEPDEQLRLRVLAGRQGENLYLLLQVEDDHLLYQLPGETRARGSDHLRLGLRTPEGEFRQYLISTVAPGWVNAQFMTANPSLSRTLGADFRIRGEWQEWEKGYQVELRLPVALVGGRLAVAVNDVDSDDREGDALIGSGDTRYPSGLGPLVTTDATLSELLNQANPHSSRSWLLSREGLVLGRAGELFATPSSDRKYMSTTTTPWILGELFRWIMHAPPDEFVDRPGPVSRLSDAPVSQALAGTPASHRRRSTDDNAVVLSAAYPLYADGKVIGAVLVEQTTQEILSLQNAALKRLYGVSLLLIGTTGLLLLGYASLLTSRIRRLRDNLEQAVSDDGRILGTVQDSRKKDEIGDLQRSFAGVLQRLSEYNRYLESMASRLAHELRTPMSVIRTSLDNLDQVDREQAGKYVQRAREGVDRLELILQRMREASRLEQTLQQAERAPLDLCAFLNYALEGYRGIYPQVNFELELPDAPLKIPAAADLLAQALDKLVANAVDFHRTGTPVRVGLYRDGKALRLQVSNEGPPLPDSVPADSLFQSLVSCRTGGQESELGPNLGLGLYIVRLIAEFHGGEARGENLPDGRGVRVYLQLPAIEK